MSQMSAEHDAPARPLVLMVHAPVFISSMVA